MHIWVITPERQQESRFPGHKQYIHLSTVCDMYIKDSLRDHHNYKSKTLLFLHDTYCSSSCEIIQRTEWAEEAILDYTCGESCQDCPEYTKSWRQQKIECRMRRRY